MHHELLFAVIAGLGGMLGWGCADFFAKRTIDTIGDVTTLFWSQLIGVFPLVILFFFKPEVPAIGIVGAIWLVILGAWSGLSYIPTYVAFGKGKVSLLSPIFSTYALVVTILSATFLGERIPSVRWLAFAIVFLGIILINGNPWEIWGLIAGRRESRVQKIEGLPEISLAIVLYSAWLIALDRFIDGKYWVPVFLVIRIFSAASLFLYARVTNRGLVVPERSLWPYLVLIGICDVAAFSFVSFGFSVTRYVSIVAMLSGAFSLPTIVLATLFLKEGTTRLQTVGSLAIIVGVILLAVR